MSQAQVESLKALLKARTPPPSIDAWRAGFEGLASRLQPPSDLSRTPTLDGEITLPPGEPRGVVLYLHGGAFQVGSSKSYRHVAARLAEASGAAVYMLDYALAPESRYPVARDQAAERLSALIEAHGAGFTAIAGDSCGANLALSALATLKRRGRPQPAGAVLISAYLDLTHSGNSIRQRAHRDPFIDVEGMPATAAVYAGETDPADPGVSPLFADLAGLPPLLIQVGTEEVLFDDSLRLKDAATAEGVAATLDVNEGMVHAWPFFWPMLDEGGLALDRAGGFLKGLYAV